MLQRHTKASGWCGLCLAIILSACLAQAAEIQYPVSAFSPDELAKVREWEKTWANKKIDKTNIDQVAEFMPPSYAQAYKEPEKWGAPADDFYFVIIPYKQIVETKGMIEATKKYAPQVKVNAEGYIENYADLAGMPFPNPTTGLEVAWNFDFNSKGDANHYWTYGPVITPGAAMERKTKTERWELFWIHRVDVNPLPKYEQNPKGIHRGMFQHMYEPPESQNTRFFNLRYIDAGKADDGYMYYAPFRRIRRIAVGQRTDTVDGSDIIYDDEYGWDGHISRNTYKYIGRKELLCSRQTDLKSLIRKPGQSLPSNMKRERLSTFVVEVYNKDPNYLYSKRVWYMDPETYLVQWTELYDDLKRFWKCFEMPGTDFPTLKGENKKMIAGILTMDFQRTHAANLWEEWIEIGLPQIDMNLFTIQSLQKTY